MMTMTLMRLFVIDLLKNKSQPEVAANEAEKWVISEREMRVRMKRENEERELKEKLEVRTRELCYIT